MRLIMKNKILFLFFLSFHVIQTANAEFQSISLQTDVSSISPGDQFTLTVQYDISNKANTTGIGIAIHFDSEIINISDNDILYVFPTGMSGKPLIRDESEIESQKENDPNTDKVIVFFWSDIFGRNWPNDSLPLNLANLKFTALKKFDMTTINVSDTTLANGYDFKSTSITVPVYLKGDTNMDGVLDIKDAINLINFIGYKKGDNQ